MVCQKFIAVLAICICSLSDGVRPEEACNAANITADAQTILNSKFDPIVVASILPYRTQPECAEINTLIADSNAGKPLVDCKYTPLGNTKPYDDLLFALVNDPMTVFSKYLGHYRETKDKSYIIMIFIQIDDRMKFIEIYNRQHDVSFGEAREKIDEPFRRAFKAWSSINRIDISIYSDKDDSCDQGKWLTNERGKWMEHGVNDRTGLEGMLMRHTIEYAQRGLRCYKSNLLEDIRLYIASDDLVETYTSLVYCIQNDNAYLAKRLHDHCDEKDKFTLWIVVLTTRRTVDAMKALDEAFRAAYKIPLKDFVLKCNCKDVVFKHLLADLIDQSYKPA